MASATTEPKIPKGIYVCSKFAYSFDGNEYYNGCSTLRATLEEARKDASDDVSRCLIRNGKLLVWAARTHPYPWTPVDASDADVFIESMQEKMAVTLNDLGLACWDTGWLDDVSAADCRTLASQLNETFWTWVVMTNHLPFGFYVLSGHKIWIPYPANE